MRRAFKGRAWVFGNNVDTDQVIPAEYLVTMDGGELAKHTFAKARPQFAKGVEKGDIIVAGRNFGCGSSREHAPRALIGSGISCVVAESYARIFFRNAINIGLPVVEAKISVSDGDTVSVDVSKGTVLNTRTGESVTFKAYPEFVTMLMDKGGLIPYTKERLGCRRSR